MKKIIYNIAIVLAASCLFASCEDDNYDEPNSGYQRPLYRCGNLRGCPDAGTGYQQLSRYVCMSVTVIILRVMITRSFRLSRIPRSMGLTRTRGCSCKQYILTLEQTNFYPVDTMVVDLNAGGLTDQDIKVIPYARIDVNNAVFENKKLKVSYTITRSKE